MRKILLFGMMMMIGTTALAFGGGGNGRVAIEYKGVDSIGVYYDPDKTIDPPEWIDCNEDSETEVSGVCCKNEKVYTEDEIVKCCEKDGYAVTDGKCQKSCEEGLVPVGDECVDLCEGYSLANECMKCDPATGNPIPDKEGELCDSNQGRCVEGTCTPIVCDICTELNSSGECDTKTCGANEHCDSDTSSETKNTCICDDNYEVIVGSCVEKCPSGVTRNTDNSCTVCINGNIYVADEENHCRMECLQNSDCTTGKYCKLESDANNCYKPNIGTCEEVASAGYTSVSITGLGTVRKSNDTMTWWTADNWCKAQGKSLIGLNGFACYQSGTSDPIETGTGAGYCCIGNDKTCGSWENYWNGTNVKSGKGPTINTKYSVIMTRLRKSFGETYLWTASDFSETDACFAFFMNLRIGRMMDYDRDDLGVYALCK